MAQLKFKAFKKPVIKKGYELDKNDVFHIGGKIDGNVAFDRWKQGKKSLSATALENGGGWTIRTIRLNDDVSVIGTRIEEEVIDDTKLVKEGTLFAIKSRKGAELLRCTGFTRTGKIECENPLDETQRFTVNRGTPIRLVADLMK